MEGQWRRFATDKRPDGFLPYCVYNARSGFYLSCRPPQTEIVSCFTEREKKARKSRDYFKKCFKTFIQRYEKHCKQTVYIWGVDIFCCCVIKFILLTKMCGLRVLQQWSSGTMVNTNWKDNLLSMAHILYKYHLLFGVVLPLGCARRSALLSLSVLSKI